MVASAPILITKLYIPADSKNLVVTQKASGMIMCRNVYLINNETLLYVGVFGYFYYLAGRVPFNGGASAY